MIDENNKKQDEIENMLNLDSLINGKQKNSIDERKNNVKKNENDENIEILEDFNKIKNDGIDAINKQINQTNEKLVSFVDKYNKTLDDDKKISDLYGEKITEMLFNEYSKNNKQLELGDAQVALEAKQSVIQNDLQNNKQQIEYLKEAGLNLEKKEKQGDKNPLMSAGYLQRVLSFMNEWLKKEQEAAKKEINKDKERLKKKSDDFKKELNTLTKKKQQKAKTLSRKRERNVSKRRSYNNKINDIYENKFAQINKRYKKILGLEQKYFDEISSTKAINDKRELINEFKSDVDSMLKASSSDLKEEDNKFDEKGNRVETKLEKKERKKKEKLEKKMKKNNLNQNDNNSDAKIKKAYSDYNNQKSDDNGKLQIKDINESNNIINNTGVNSTEKNLPRIGI